MCNSQKDNEIVQILSQNISQKVVNTLLKWFKEDATEGLEEVFTDIVNKVAQKLTYADKMTWEKVFSTEDAWDSFLSGLLLSRGMSGADAIIVNSNAFQNAGLEDIAGKLSRGEALSVAEQQRLLDAVLKNTAPGTAADSNQSSRVTEPGKFGMTGWDGRVAVEPATGPNVTVDGKTYALLGKDANGAPVYQDVEVLKEQSEQPERDTQLLMQQPWIEAATSRIDHTIPGAGKKADAKYRLIKQSVDADIDDTDIANKHIDDKIAMTNPAYSSGDPAYRQNCQRCVAAYEMRRRGYDVIAKPAIIDSEGNLSSEDPLTKTWKEIFEGAVFLPYTDYEGGRTSIIAQMEAWGEGAVAEVKVIWKKGGAHVFIAQYVNGSVRFIDPQSGNKNCEDYFTNAVIGATMMARIDTLQPTDLIEKCIKNRGGKA